MAPAADPTNPQLIRAMDQVARNDNTQTRSIPHERLLEAVLLLPVAERPNQVEGWQTAQQETPIQLIVTQDKGETVMLAFTDTAGLLRWRPAGCAFVGMPAADVFPLAIASRFASIVVNVAGPTGGRITRREFQFLAKGVLPGKAESAMMAGQVQQQTVAYLGAPSLPPRKALIDAVATGLDGHQPIKAAYLFQFKIGQGEPHLMLGLVPGGVLTKEQAEFVVRDLMERLNPVLGDGEYLECMVLDASWLKDVQRFVRPVFQRAA